MNFRYHIKNRSGGIIKYIFIQNQKNMLNV